MFGPFNLSQSAQQFHSAFPISRFLWIYYDDYLQLPQNLAVSQSLVTMRGEVRVFLIAIVYCHPRISLILIP